MPVSELIAKLTNMDATRGDVQAQTLQRLMSVAMGQQKLDREAKLAAVQDQAAAQMAPYVAQQASLDKDKSPTQIIDDQINDYKSQYGLKVQQQKLYESKGFYPEAKVFETEANHLLSQTRLAQLEKLKVAQADAQQMGNLVSSIHDQPTLEAALPLIRKDNPTFGMQGQWDRDQNNEIKYGPKTAAQIEVISGGMIKAEDKVKNAQALANEQDRIARAEQTDKRAQERIDQSERHFAARLATVDDRADRREAAAEKKATEAKQARIDRVVAATMKPATVALKNSARATITSDPDMKNKKWDSSLDALTSDVADRANQIRAEAIRHDEDMSYEDARQQAWDEHKSFVKPVKSGGFLGLGQDERLTYIKSGAGQVTAPKTTDDTTPKPVVDALIAATPVFNKANVFVNAQGGKTKISAESAATDKVKQYTKEAQAAIDEGKDPAAVLKRLAELVK